MTGNNELRLCKAEMKVAMQEYLDKRMGVYAPSVSDVEQRDQAFRIALADRDVCRGSSPESVLVCEPDPRRGRQ